MFILPSANLLPLFHLRQCVAIRNPSHAATITSFCDALDGVGIPQCPASLRCLPSPPPPPLPTCPAPKHAMNASVFGLNVASSSRSVGHVMLCALCHVRADHHHTTTDSWLDFGKSRSGLEDITDRKKVSAERMLERFLQCRPTSPRSSEPYQRPRRPESALLTS